MAGKVVHAESKKKVNLILVDDICDIIDHYIQNDTDKQIILNMGMPKVTTYYELLVDAAEATGLDPSLIDEDGEEPGWLDNNTLSTEKQRSLGYPQRSYEEVIQVIADGIKNAS